MNRILKKTTINITINFINISMSTHTNEDEMVEVTVNMSKLKRPFPHEIEHLLPLRTCFMDYKKDGGRILVSEENKETSMDDSEGVTMYTSACQIGIIGHAYTVEARNRDVVVSRHLCVCEPEIMDLSPSMMASAIMRTYNPAFKWVIGDNPAAMYPIAPPTALMYKTALCYELNTPLTMYTNLAVLEAQKHSGNSSFWKSLYEPMESVERHYTTPGIMYDNILLSIGDMAGSDDKAEIKNRNPSMHTGGFLDTIVTPQSKASGRVRVLAAGTSIRVMTKRTIQMAYELMSGLTNAIGIGIGDWVLRCMGYCCKINFEDVKRIVDKWKNMNERNMPTLHVFMNAKVIVISISSGTVLRPMRLHVIGDKFVYEGPYVDTMTVYHSDTLKIAKMKFPSRELEPQQYANIITLTYAPFSAFTTEPRPNLAAQMMLQGMNTMPVQGDATMVSLGQQEPLIMSSHMNAIRCATPKGESITLPNKYVVTAFINRTLNTEDACSISEPYANAGHFAWMGEINYPIPSDCGHVRPGMVLKDQPWWKPNLEGIVTRVGMSKVGDPYAVVLVGSRSLEIGDKLATTHGLKFTTGEKLTYEEMPTLVDVETGDEFKPNLLLSTKNVTRGLGGTIREMNACTSLFDSVTSFRNMQKPKGKRIYTFDDEKKVPAKLRTAYVCVNGKPLEFTDSNGQKRVIKCSYGIMGVLQLRHISSLKQHYPSRPVRSLKTRRGRYRDGTPRVGETDLLSLLMRKLFKLAKECVITTDLAKFTVCSICNALVDLCDCESPKPPAKEIMCRWSAAEVCMFLTLGMLNDPSKTPMTLRFLTSS